MTRVASPVSSAGGIAVGRRSHVQYLVKAQDFEDPPDRPGRGADDQSPPDRLDAVVQLQQGASAYGVDESQSADIEAEFPAGESVDWLDRAAPTTQRSGSVTQTINAKRVVGSGPINPSSRRRFEATRSGLF